MADTEVKGYYTIDGKLYPRVTHVLNIMDKPGLARWRGRVGNTEADRVSSEGASIGTEFHEIVADINRGAHKVRGWSPPSRFRDMAFTYIDWLHKEIGQILEVEKLVISEENQFAGTLDFVAYFRGDDLPSVIDIKTSNSPSADWPLQLSAYKMALEEESGLKIARRVVLRVPKKGACIIESFEYENHEEDELAWMNALGLWLWSRKDKERLKSSTTKGKAKT